MGLSTDAMVRLAPPRKWVVAAARDWQHGPVPYDVRPLTPADDDAAWLLGSTAFGYRDAERPENWTANSPSRHVWGVFDESGRMLAKAVDLEQSHWFGGRIVPASGIAAVAVAPEVRGVGLSRMMLTRLLEGARARGAVISTLFDTTPFPYRAVGFEEVGALTYRSFPATAFTGVRVPDGVTLRPAVEADVPVIHELYLSMARSGAGLIERSGPRFTREPAQLLTDFHGVTVAIVGGEVHGYALWDRGSGYDSTGQVTVFDLIADLPQAAKALLSMLGTWAYVAPTVVLRVPDDDPLFTMIAASAMSVQSRQPWMLRLIDLAGAVAARGWPAHLTATVDLEVEDASCPWNAGSRRLVFAGGEGHVETINEAGTQITARGLSALYAGAATPANLRRAGLLAGDTSADPLLSAAFAGPRPAILDYF